MTSCIRCVVYGKVQGVWFRGGAQRQAAALGIAGYARNRLDGTVEVLACGENAALEALKNWLRQGPPGARVDELVCAPAEDQTPSTFTVG